MFPMNQQAAAFFQNLQNLQAPNNMFTAFQSFFPANGQFPDAAKTVSATSEQFSAAVKTTIDGQIAFLNRLTAVTVQGTEKLVDLNMTAAKTSMEESVVVTKQLMSSKDAREFVGFLAALPQPTMTKAVAYSRHVATISSEAQAEVTRASEERFAEAGRQLLAVLEQAFKNAPAGSENMLAAAKTALANANNGLEQFNQKTKQAVDTVEATVNGVMDQAVQAAEQANAAAQRSRKQ